MLTISKIEEMKKIEQSLEVEIKSILENEEANNFQRKMRREIIQLLDENIGPPKEDGKFTFYNFKYKQAEKIKERFFAFVTPVTKKNNNNRIYKKLTDTISAFKKEGNEEWKEKPWSQYINDLFRFRIVCCYLSDVFYLANKIAEISRNAYLQQRGRSIKDYIFGKRPNERANAVKSIHFRFMNNQKVNVELQLMTLLHYGWDQIEHNYFEDVRENSNDLKTDTENKGELRTGIQYWAASDSLYLIDEQLMTLRQPEQIPGGLEMRDLLTNWEKNFNSIVSVY